MRVSRARARAVRAEALAGQARTLPQLSRREFVRTAAGIFVPAIVGLTSKGASLVPFNPQIRTVAGGGGMPTWLIQQDFETATTIYDHSEVWTEVGSTISANTTTPLFGTQSVRLSGTNIRLTSPSHTGLDEAWYYWATKFATIPAGIRTNYVTIIGAGFGIDIESSGSIRVSGSQNGTPTTNTVTTGVLYHFLVHYLKGSGANANYSVEFNTTATFTNAPGNGYSVVTNGSETSQSTAIRYLAEEATTFTVDIDKVRAAASQIPNNPT